MTWESDWDLVPVPCFFCRTMNCAAPAAQAVTCSGCGKYAVFPTCPRCHQSQAAWTDGRNTAISCSWCAATYDIKDLMRKHVRVPPTKSEKVMKIVVAVAATVVFVPILAAVVYVVAQPDEAASPASPAAPAPASRPGRDLTATGGGLAYLMFLGSIPNTIAGCDGAFTAVLEQPNSGMTEADRGGVVAGCVAADQSRMRR